MYIYRKNGLAKSDCYFIRQLAIKLVNYCTLFEISRYNMFELLYKMDHKYLHGCLYTIIQQDLFSHKDVKKKLSNCIYNNNK